MADEQAPGPSAEKPIWVKDPETGKVISIHTPEDIQAARANNFVDATEQERNQAYQQKQLQGWKGTTAAAVAGAAENVPFIKHVVGAVAPGLAADVDRSEEAHPWVHGAANLAGFVAGGELLKGAGLLGEGAVKAGEMAAEASAGTLTKVLPAAAEKGLIAAGDKEGMRAAIAAVDAKLAEGTVAAAGETGVKAAVPTLAQRVLGRLPDMAQNAQVGLAAEAIHLTNESDLPATPEELAGHIMGSLFWGAAGGVAGGELMHGLIKGASGVVNATSKAFAKGSEALDNMAAALKGGNGESVVAKSRGALQGSLDAIDTMGKERDIDKGMEAVRKKVGDEGMKDFDAARIKAEDAYKAAKGDVLGMLGGKGSQKGRISADKVAKALNSDQRQDVLEALQRFHEAGKGLQDFHEMLAQAGATGSEGLAGRVKEQVDGLLEVQDAMKAGIAKASAKGAMDEILQGGLGYGLLEHFGKALLGKAYVAGKVGKVLVQMAPAEWKAGRLAQLARLAEGVNGHLDRVAAATANGGSGKFATPAAALLSADEFHKLRDDVNSKVSNPELALQHFQDRAGAVEHYAPDTYAQMSVQYGQQLMALQQVLSGPVMMGAFSPKYMPSATELQKASTAVAIIKDPRVFEAKVAKGTATPAEAKVYASAHGSRAAALSAAVAKGYKEGMKYDKNTLKAMTSSMVLNMGAPRMSYSQPMLQAIQGGYAMKATQQGGPGSRGGTGGAKALTASQSISLPGQRVANRPIK